MDLTDSDYGYNIALSRTTILKLCFLAVNSTNSNPIDKKFGGAQQVTNYAILIVAIHTML